MDKERLFDIPESYSEKKTDLAVDKTSNDDQVRSGNVYVPPKISKKPSEDK